MLYRVIKPLSTGHVPGELVREADFKEGIIAVLMQVGAIAVAKTPPLWTLPGWEKRAERLEGGGIETVADLLNATDEDIAAALGRKTTRGIAEWKNEARNYITVPAERAKRK
jgi:hypothetical protein